jgi:hypothetical protein
VDPDNRPQVDLMYSYLRHNMAVVDFWLNHRVYPTESRQFPQRLAASAWHVADNTRGRVVGFSGTNDNRRLLPLQVHGAEIQEHSLHATNGKMLDVIMRSTLGLHVLLTREVRGGSPRTTACMYTVLSRIAWAWVRNGLPLNLQDCSCPGTAGSCPGTGERVGKTLVTLFTCCSEARGCLRGRAPTNEHCPQVHETGVRMLRRQDLGGEVGGGGGGGGGGRPLWRALLDTALEEDVDAVLDCGALLAGASNRCVGPPSLGACDALTVDLLILRVFQAALTCRTSLLPVSSSRRSAVSL